MPDDSVKVACPQCGVKVDLRLEPLGIVAQGEQATLRFMASGSHTCQPKKDAKPDAC